MRIAWVAVEFPVAVLPRASVEPHSIEPCTLLEVLNATRNEVLSVSQMEGPRVRPWAGNDGCKKATSEPRGLRTSPRLRMVIRPQGGMPPPTSKTALLADYVETDSPNSLVQSARTRSCAYQADHSRFQTVICRPRRGDRRAAAARGSGALRSRAMGSTFLPHRTPTRGHVAREIGRASCRARRDVLEA